MSTQRQSMARAVAAATVGILLAACELAPRSSPPLGPSPTPNRIAFSSGRDGNEEIYVMTADGTGVRRLTNHPADDIDPAWSPDGARIAFRSDRDGYGDIYVMNADGTGLARLTNHPAVDGDPAWSPDGTRIAFMSNRDGPFWNWGIYVMNADGRNPTRLTNNTAADWGPDWR